MRTRSAEGAVLAAQKAAEVIHEVGRLTSSRLSG